jgi:hypothetical protein
LIEALEVVMVKELEQVLEQDLERELEQRLAIWLQDIKNGRERLSCMS